MTDLSRYSGSLKRQIGQIKRRITDAKTCFDKAKSYQSSADSYYQSYRHARGSSSDYYYNKYRSYSDVASSATAEGNKLSVIIKELIKDYRENVEQIIIIMDGRDSHIQNLKKAIAQQAILLEKSQKANSNHRADVLATYARGNYALLAGVINSVKKGVDADSLALLNSLQEVNDGARRHAERLIGMYAQSQDDTIEAFESLQKVSDIESSSLISSIGNLFEAKSKRYKQIAAGDTDKIVESLGYSVTFGLILNSGYNKIASMWKN